MGWTTQKITDSKPPARTLRRKPDEAANQLLLTMKVGDCIAVNRMPETISWRLKNLKNAGRMPREWSFIVRKWSGYTSRIWRVS